MERIITFLEEYAAFFEQVEQKQEEKLATLTKGELSAVEQTIVMQQALDKQIQNMEQRRIQLFLKEGFDGKTFKELLELAQNEAYYSQLEALYQRIEHSVTSVKFINQKCVKLAQTALAGMGVTNFPTNAPKKSQAKGYEAYRAGTGSILQTKI